MIKGFHFIDREVTFIEWRYVANRSHVARRFIAHDVEQALATSLDAYREAPSNKPIRTAKCVQRDEDFVIDEVHEEKASFLNHTNNTIGNAGDLYGLSDG